MTMCFKILITTFVFNLMYNCEPVLADNVLQISKWTGCSSSEHKLQMFSDHSLERCEEKCLMRTNCSLMNYYPLSKTCELLRHHGASTTHQKNRPCIQVTRSQLNHTITCNANDTDCNETICQVPVVANATVKGNINTVGSKAKVICNLGYGIKTGSSETICNETGDWTDMPNCVPVCPAPPDANFSNVDQNITHAFEGTIVTYSCEPTYATAGQENITATCQANGSWSDLLFQCQIACENPDPVANASLLGGEIVVNARFTYSCDTGFITTDGTDNFTRTCQQNRSWTEPSAYCRKDCYEPKDLGNATLQSGKTYETTNRTYVCDDGYISTQSTNKFTVTCQNDGNWTISDIKCLSDCKSPLQHVPNAHMRPASQPTYDGSVVFLRCHDHREFEFNNGSRVTDHTVTCNNGTWEDVGLAKCEFKCPKSNDSYEQVGSQRLVLCKKEFTKGVASEACSRFGSLVKLDTTERRTYIKEYLNNQTLTSYDREEMWIQGRRNKYSNKWLFDDESEITLPHGFVDNPALECLSITKLDGHLKAINCDRPYYYICEMQ